MADETPPVTLAPPMNYGMLVEKYMLLREKKDAIKKTYTEDTKVITDLMDRIEGVINQHLQDNGLQNLSTPHGTAYLNTKWSATVSDPDAFRTHLIGQLAAGKGWTGADIRANAPQIRQYLEENNALPPGVNLTQLVEVNIRKK